MYLMSYLKQGELKSFLSKLLHLLPKCKKKNFEKSDLLTNF